MWERRDYRRARAWALETVHMNTNRWVGVVVVAVCVAIVVYVLYSSWPLHPN